MRLTDKAIEELDRLGLEPEDGFAVLAALSESDFVERLPSRITDEWMYVFAPLLGPLLLYVKVVLRPDCVVISFHEVESEDET